jgi:hypothetical protein
MIYHTQIGQPPPDAALLKSQTGHHSCHCQTRSVPFYNSICASSLQAEVVLPCATPIYRRRVANLAFCPAGGTNQWFYELLQYKIWLKRIGREKSAQSLRQRRGLDRGKSSDEGCRWGVTSAVAPAKRSAREAARGVRLDGEMRITWDSLSFNSWKPR